MPFVTHDPREGHECYRGVEVPADVVVPTIDLVAWHFYPEWAHVYNRMELARRQGIPSGPIELNPEPEDTRSSSNRSTTSGVGVGAAGRSSPRHSSSASSAMRTGCSGPPFTVELIAAWTWPWSTDVWTSRIRLPGIRRPGACLTGGRPVVSRTLIAVDSSDGWRPNSPVIPGWRTSKPSVAGLSRRTCGPGIST